MTKRVLILCTGNSCRSQMAQVIWEKLANGVWNAESAGSLPAGFVHPLAIEALKEIGLETRNLYSKSINEFFGQNIDLSITVCDHAKEACPILPGVKQTLHWPFVDPADATGRDEEKMICFRIVRDQIWNKIETFLADHGTQSVNSKGTIVTSAIPEFSAEAIADCLALIKMALREDIGATNISAGVDCTTDAIVPRAATAQAAFVSRAKGIVCGVEICKLAIRQFANRLALDVQVADGQQVTPKQTIAVLSGPAHDILTMERTCLNFMCRLSGISSLTRQYVDEIAGTTAQVFDTRKTTPGWRRLEKYAVACGGGQNHRMGLYDAVMIKDNHLAFYRSLVEDTQSTIPQAIGLARQWIADHQATLPNGRQTIVQLEVDTLEQLRIGLQTDCDIVLLDNMTAATLAEAVELRNRTAPKILLEASGGVNLKTIHTIARTGVERISVGALTHSAVNFDIGLDWKID